MNKPRHSKVELVYHAVWATKLRKPILVPELQAKLEWTVDSALSELGGTMISYGCGPDHMHILFYLPPSVPLVKGIQEMKSRTSRVAGPAFKWQRGYFVTTVTPGNRFAESLKKCQTYIRNHKNQEV